MRLILRVEPVTEPTDLLVDLLVVDVSPKTLRRIKERADRLVAAHAQDQDLTGMSYRAWDVRFYVGYALEDYLARHDPKRLLDQQGYVFVDDDAELPEPPGVGEEDAAAQGRYPGLETLELELTASGSVCLYWRAYEQEAAIATPAIFLADFFQQAAALGP